MASSNSLTYIPLTQAAEQYGFSEKALREYVEAGLIPCGELPNGEYLVAVQELDPSVKIKREDFEELRGQKLGAMAAERKYGIDNANFSKWARAGHITIYDDDRLVLLDEADVAYCAAIYQTKARLYGGQMSGVPVLDQDGNPYQVKYRDAAARLRAVRRQRAKRTAKQEAE